MPFVIPAIVAGLAAMTALEIGIMVLSIALTVGSTVFGAAQQKSAAKKAKRAAARAREDFLNSLQERTVTRIAAEAPHVYVYGRARVGSAIVGVFAGGGNDEFKHLICIHAAHECDAIESVYIDGKELGPLDADGNVTTGDFFLSNATENITENFATSPFTLSHTPSSAIKVLGFINWTAQSRDDAFAYGLFNETSGTEVSFTRSSGNTITASGTITRSHSLGGGTTKTFPASSYRVTYQYQNGTPQVRVRVHLGTADDVADSLTMSDIPAKWASTSVLRGFCYTVVRLDLRQPLFQGGVPGVEVLMRGKKLYDPRNGSVLWSENPALAIYDYLTSPFCAVPSTDLPSAYFITAANVCDEAQSFGNRYTCNGTVTSDQDQANILEAMAQSMAGSIVATTWEVTAGKYIAPIASLSQSDIVGALAVTPGISDADIINGVRGQNITAANLYVATDYEPYQNATYLASDGKDKYANIDFPFTDTKQRVHNLARIITEDQRNGFTVKANLSLKAWDIHIGDRVTFTSAFLGQTSKVYRVTDKKYSPDSSIEMTMKEDAASIWDFADSVSIDDTPNSDLPDPFLVESLGFLTLDSGTDALLIQQDGTIVSRILATWGVSSMPARANGEIQIEWKRDTELAWRKTVVTADEIQAYLMPVEDGAWYLVRARAVNPYINARSDWVYADLHQVVGKSEPPGNIENLAIEGTILTWTAVTDLDLAGYVFRHHYGSNLDWNTAIPLHNGVITNSPYPLTSLPFGATTIMGKAQDTSGNESEETANIFTNLGDAPVGNIVQAFSFDPLFPGSYSYGSVVGLELVASAQDSFYADDAQSFYGDDSQSFYKPSTGYRQMVYETDEIILSGALVGSKITLDLTAIGSDVRIEYAVTGEGSFYGPDADPFYEPGTSTGSTSTGADVFDSVNLTGFDSNNPNSFAVVDVADFDPTSANSFLAVEGFTFSSVATDSFYSSGTGAWMIWPGQVTARAAGYQFRITIGSGLTPGRISNFDVIVDAPDKREVISNLLIGATATAIPYTKDFTAITGIAAQLQANASGAESVEIDKTSPLAPTIKAYNSSHVAVAGATADIFLEGY